EGGQEALDRLVAQAKLHVGADRDKTYNPEAIAVEAVVTQNSSLIGWSAQHLMLYDRFNVNLLAVSRKGARLDQRLGSITLNFGDILMLRGDGQTLPQFLRDFGLLPLAERQVLLGSVRRGLVPV